MKAVLRFVFSPVILIGIIWGFISGAFMAGQLLSFIIMEKHNED